MHVLTGTWWDQSRSNLATYWHTSVYY